jgi:tetratricopeptide (TPR) repeat protein
MEKFNQLLNRYVQQAGISDSELARTLGVSRQTVFRWREGQTGRPRHREDILVIARKLRLTPAERDILLLAAGFPPEVVVDAPVATSVSTPALASAEEAFSPDQATDFAEDTPQSLTGEVAEFTASRSQVLLERASFLRLGVVALGLILLGGSFIWWFQRDTVERNLKPLMVQTPSAVSSGGSIPAPATEGEKLILVTHFANYASSQVGYNVAGRVTEALQQEIEQSRLPQMRVGIWPEVVGEAVEAEQAGQAISATLVIYGEYDVGRIVVKFAYPPGPASLTLPALQREALDVQALSAIINGDIPQQVRSLALLALGQIYLSEGDLSQAQTLLLQARDQLQAQPQGEPQTQAVANFYLGMAYQRQQPPDLEETIAAYTTAISAWPEMLSSYLNRSAAYLERSQAGDLERALADADKVVEAKPGWGLAYYNRASIRLWLGQPEATGLALADLDQALSLEPELAEARFNRAYIYLQQGEPLQKTVSELEKVLALRPEYGNALNLLCWSYALDQQPETALPYCQQALQLEPGRAEFQDSRGLVYALQGQDEAAITDFEAYATWLEQDQALPAWEKELAQRRSWIEALKAGQNPFTPEVLRELQQGFGK